jgi:hypothetical protein
LETIAGIFLFEETRPERAAFNLDALYAWNQQDIPVYVPDCDHYHYCKAGDDEEVKQVTSYSLPRDKGQRKQELALGPWNLKPGTWNCFF